VVVSYVNTCAWPADSARCGAGWAEVTAAFAAGGRKSDPRI